MLIAAQRLCRDGLALSGAHAPALPKGEPFGRGKAANSLQRVHISIHNNRKGVPHEPEKAACLHLYKKLLLRPAHRRRGVGGAAGCALVGAAPVLGVLVALTGAAALHKTR